MPGPDFLAEKRNEIGARLRELEPLLEEYRRLEAAAAALDGVTASALSSAATRSSSPQRARPAARSPGRAQSADGPGAARPTRRATRREQLLALVQANPGISASELAATMGINRNYLYRVLPALAEAGLVVRDGRGWKPRGAD